VVRIRVYCLCILRDFLLLFIIQSSCIGVDWSRKLQSYSLAFSVLITIG